MVEASSMLGFLVGVLCGLCGMVLFWVLQQQQQAPPAMHEPVEIPAPGASMTAMPTTTATSPSPPPGLPDPSDAVLPDLLCDSAPDAPGTTAPTLQPTSPHSAMDGAPAPNAPVSQEVTEDAIEGLKHWMGSELTQVVLQPLRKLQAGQSEILKSFPEVLEDQSKMDTLLTKLAELQTALDGNPAHQVDALKSKMDHLDTLLAKLTELQTTLEGSSTPQVDALVSKVSSLQADLDKITSATQGIIKIEDKLMGKVDELSDLAGRRHAYLETATDGTQDQIRGVTHELQALATSFKDHRQVMKDATTETQRRHMEILKKLSTLSSKVHNGFAGLSGIGRSAMAAAQESKEVSERGLEISEKTLAAVRVAGPSPSETALLEKFGDMQTMLDEVKHNLSALEGSLEALRSHVATAPAPPPPYQPVVSQTTVPPPPQHAPNLVHLTPAGGGWQQGPGPTAAVMLGNPQHLLRALAGQHPLSD
ncbi:unnamed protein product [Symbiodinium sp. CCMP2592]|nr:unnamed protein product [Symbiodinium sp. CCMP2592]